MTEAVAVRAMLSVVSSAVYVTDSLAESTTLNVAAPLLSVVLEMGVIVELPVAAVRDTIFPATGRPSPPAWSCNVTVIVDAVVPSDGTDIGLAITVEFAGVTTGAVNMTDAVSVIVTLSVVSSAV